MAIMNVNYVVNYVNTRAQLCCFVTFNKPVVNFVSQ